MLHAVRAGLARLWRTVPLRWNTIIDNVYVLASGILFVGFPAFALSVGAGAHASGYMWAAISAGLMVGSFALTRHAAGRSPRVLMGGCMLAMALSAAAWWFAGSLAGALPLIFLTGLLDGPALVAPGRHALNAARGRARGDRLRRRAVVSGAHREEHLKPQQSPIICVHPSGSPLIGWHDSGVNSGRGGVQTKALAAAAWSIRHRATLRSLEALQVGRLRRQRAADRRQRRLGDRFGTFSVRS